MYNTQLKSNHKFDLFEKISSTNNEMNSQEIMTSLKTKRALIRQMLFQEIKKKIKKETTTKKSFTLQEFIKNMGKYLFGEYGKLTKRVPYLQKEYIRLRNIRKLQFQEKINVGDLTYYNIDSWKKERKSRLVEIEKNSLTRSSFFFVPKQEKDYTNSHKPKRYSKKLKQKRDFSLKQINDINNHTVINSALIYPKQNSIRWTSYSYLPQSTKPIISKQVMTNPNNYITDYQHCKNNKTVIETKLKEICIRQSKLKKKLFKIIDKASISQKNQRILNEDKDNFKKLFNIKIKYKKVNLRDMFNETFRSKNSYSMMDPIKSKLIQLSDSIHNINDKTALLFADNILNEYEEHSKKVSDFLIAKKFEVRLTRNPGIIYQKQQIIGKVQNKYKRCI